MDRWLGMCTYVLYACFFFFKQKTAYEMRISDWSSDVCSSDLTMVETDRAGAHGSRRRPAHARHHGAGIHATGQERSKRHVGDQDRKSVVSGKSVSVRVDLGGRRIIKKKV